MRNFVVALAVCLCLGQAYGFTLQSKTFDHLVYAQQWMPSFDSELGIQNWTIHGLWPSSFNGQNPSYCNEVQFNPKTFEPLKDRMIKYWPSEKINSGDVYKDSLKFWKHEWEKHGTCAMSLKSIKSEFDYFQTALDLHEKYHMLSLLQSVDIVPSSTGTYEVSEILEKLTNLLGKSPSISCLKKDNLIGQIYVCLDKQFNIIDCPEAVLVCNENVPVKYNVLN